MVAVEVRERTFAALSLRLNIVDHLGSAELVLRQDLREVDTHASVVFPEPAGSVRYSSKGTERRMISYLYRAAKKAMMIPSYSNPENSAYPITTRQFRNCGMI